MPLDLDRNGLGISGRRWDLFILFYCAGTLLLGCFLADSAVRLIAGRHLIVGRLLVVLCLPIMLLGLSLWLSPRPSVTVRLILASTITAMSGWVAVCAVLHAVPNQLPIAISSGAIFCLLSVRQLRAARCLTRRSS